VAAPRTPDALELALRALRVRDRSERELDEHLDARGISEAARAEALATLRRTGLLDDRRFAEGRAAALAGRGAGDALIRHELASAGVAEELVDEALTMVDPELERARSVVARRGAGARTARYLSAKGFSPDVVGAIAGGSGDELG
jgi:SOS response regulatory protein OraA/RecX